MPVSNDTRRVEAPALPLPPTVYDQKFFDRFNNILRLYFNRLSVVLRIIMATDNFGVFPHTSSGDAFGRFRMSTPVTLFDSKQIHDNQPLFWDDSETSGSGTSSTHSADLARSRMSVGATTAGTRVRQTFQSFNYQPGKSQLVVLTAVIGAGGTGLTQRIGYGDAENGLFFEVDAGVMYINVRSFATGSAVNTRVAQADWNIDPLDGTGISALIADWDKTIIFLIDFSWLGVGSIRFGVMVNSVVYHVHEVHNSNTLDVVYMSKPNLPIRFEIANDGAGAAYNLDHICATVISESSNSLGITRSASTAGSPVITATEDVVYALVGVQLKTAYIGSVVKLVSLAVQIQTVSEIGEWSLILNPTVASTFAYNAVTNSAVGAAKGTVSNTVTGGTVLKSGFLESDSTGGKTIEVKLTEADNARYLGANIAGTADVIVLCWTPRGSTSIGSVEGSLTWQEL